MVLQLGEKEKLVVVGASGGIATGIYDSPIFKEVLAQDRVAALVNSTESTFDPELMRLIAQSGDKDRNKGLLNDKGDGYEKLQEIYNYLIEEGINPITIDVSNGNLTQEHLKLVQGGEKIITANKIPLATCTPEEFKKLVGPNYGGEATVMAGRGIYGDVEKATKTENKVKSIEGVFSGTMGFIMSELENGKKLSEAIKSAMDNGYTEPNPMDDLDGLDVAKKLVILARRAGHNVSIKDVGVDGLLNNSYRKFFENGVTDEAKEQFIAEIEKNEDDKVADMIKGASAREEVLRFVASLSNDNGEVTVGVGTESVPKGSQIGALSGTDNIAVMRTLVDTKTSIGPGAGIGTTATNVMKNLISVL